MRQGKFKFFRDYRDVACRDCRYFQVDYGIIRSNEKYSRATFFCGTGQFKLTHKPKDLPSVCNIKQRGVEKMGWIEFNKMSEEELKEELERLRKERKSVGRKRRKSAGKKRKKKRKKKKKPRVQL